MSTWPFTFGFHGRIVCGAMARKANALFRGTGVLEFGLRTWVKDPPTYMVLPHWVICRATSIVPSVPDIGDPPICGVAGGVEDTVA